MAGIKSLKFKHIPLKRDRLAAISSQKNTKTKKTVEIPKELAQTKVVKDTEIPVQIEKKVIIPKIRRNETIVETNKTKDEIKTAPDNTESHVFKETSEHGFEISSETTEIAESEQVSIRSTSKIKLFSQDEVSSQSEKITNSQFPNIYRFITDRWFLFGLICGILLVGIIILVSTIRFNMERKQELEKERASIQKQLTFWQKNVKQNSGYRDAYFQMALLEYQLGNFQAGEGYLAKVKLLDPNFQEAYKLEKLMQK